VQKAQVTLRQAQIDRLVSGDTVTIRLKDTELVIRFDSLATVGTGFDALLTCLRRR
jgi:hypothetical protein